MHYETLRAWVGESVETLVRIGVPRSEAECILKMAELGAVRAEIDARTSEQFLLDFDRVGATVLAHRRGCTEQAIRKHRTKLLSRKKPLVAVMVG